MPGSITHSNHQLPRNSVEFAAALSLLLLGLLVDLLGPGGRR
jgi:hypothetical protein